MFRPSSGKVCPESLLQFVFGTLGATVRVAAGPRLKTSHFDLPYVGYAVLRSRQTSPPTLTGGRQAAKCHLILPPRAYPGRHLLTSFISRLQRPGSNDEPATLGAKKRAPQRPHSLPIVRIRLAGNRQFVSQIYRSLFVLTRVSGSRYLSSRRRLITSLCNSRSALCFSCALLKFDCLLVSFEGECCSCAAFKHLCLFQCPIAF